MSSSAENNSNNNDDDCSSPSPSQRQQDVSPLTSITTAALAKIGICEEEATAMLSDLSVMRELREAQSRINEAGDVAKDILAKDSNMNTLIDALVSEGVNMSDEDIKALMEDLEKGGADDDDDENNNATKTKRTTKNDDDDDGDNDQEEFGNLIEQLTKMALKQGQKSEANSSKQQSTSVTTSNADDQQNSTQIRLLVVLPLVAEYCGALPALFSLPVVCQRWRGLLLSESRAIQRTMWIAIACNEFPVEISEFGEDAFVTIAIWSDEVRKLVRLRQRYG